MEGMRVVFIWLGDARSRDGVQERQYPDLSNADWFKTGHASNKTIGAYSINILRYSVLEKKN